MGGGRGGDVTVHFSLGDLQMEAILSVTFQGEYSAMFIASRTYLWEKEGFCTLLNSLERTLAVLFDSALLVHLSLV